MRVSVTRLIYVAAVLFIAAVTVRPAWAQLPTPNQPILVVQDSTSSNTYQNFVPQMLNTEGLNGFQVAQLSQLTGAFLGNYSVVILPHLTLTAAEAALFQNYVNAGGTLIGFRPDLQLANVFGVASLAATLPEAWLQINTSTPYSSAPVNNVLRFHGTADLYSLNGASALATLYNSATSPSTSPAASIYTYGQGQAILFSFDLAESIVLMRQGNPAWAGYPNNHDGFNTMRASQMFMDAGSGQFWNDLGNGALNDVPQADIQMRLFSNALTLASAAKLPLPRLWYYPNQGRSLVLMTGDDHSFPVADALSEINNVASFGGLFSYNLWYPFTTVSNSQVNTWLAAGNSMGVHFDDTAEIDSSGVGGSDATWNGMQGVMTNALSSFKTTYPSAPFPVTTRDHFLIWVSNDANGTADQVAQAKLFQNNGIQLDTSYSSFPDRWGYMTGSGLPMQFLDPVAGTVIPVYEQATQYEDDVQLDTAAYSLDWPIATAQSHYQLTLSNSSTMYNEVTTFLFHPELWSSYQSYVQAALQYAQSQSIPMSTTGNWLSFWQARAATSLSMPSFTSGTLTFTATGSPAGLTLLVPFASGSNAVSKFQVDGVSQSYAVASYQGVVDASVVLTAGTHSISVTYTSAGQILGQITPSSAATGTTIQVQGGSITQTVQVAANGTYVVGPLPAGSYTVTPVSPSYTFSPASKPVTLGTANVTGVNFTASALPTFTVSGAITPSAQGSGILVTLNLSGSSTVVTTTANSSGIYTFTGVAAGTYTVTPTSPTYTFNPMSASVTVTNANVTVANFAATLGQTLFTTQTPAVTNTSDGAGVNYELATALTSSAAGQITAVRFWKAPSETGTHTGSVWSSTGTLLASVTFANETASGWQQQALTTPLTITANTQYVVGVNTGNTYYVATNSGLATQIVNGTLSSVVGNNGLYGSTGTFPKSSWEGSNYFRDVVFVPAATYSASGSVSPPDNGINTTLTLSLNGTTVATATADASGNYNFSGLSSGNYTVTPTKAGFTFSPTSAPANVTTSNVTVATFTATAPVTYTVSGAITPSASGVGATVTLTLNGTTVATTTATSSGYSFTGLSTGNYTVTPTLSGYTFSPTNAPANVTTTNVTVATFTATPIPTYTVSGAITPSASGVGATVTLTLNGTTVATTTATSSGYSFTGLSTGNYTVTPTLSGYTFSPTNAPANVTTTNVTVATFTATPIPTYTVSGAITPSASGVGATVTLTLNGTTVATTTATSSGYTFAGVVAGNYTVTPTLTGYTFSPANAPANVTTTSVTVATFTATANPTGQTLFTTQTPATTNDSDGAGVNYELGMSFTSTSAGQITAVRFWKASSETGTHTGSIWSSTGTLLASVTFANETASGWQQQTLTTPLTITAGTQYVVGVNTGSTFYVATTGGLTTQVVNGNLQSVVGSNGLYGSTGTFPTSSYQGSNYFRDVVFVPGATYTVSGTITPSSVGTGTTLKLTSGSTTIATTTSNSSGTYSFTGVSNGSYTVTPTNASFTFSPTSAPATVTNGNATVANFAATAVPTYVISGTVTPAASGNGATVTLTLAGVTVATTTVNSSGSYSFTPVGSGNYTVTPTLANMTFSPTSAPANVTNANVTVANFAATASQTLFTTQTPATTNDSDGAGVNYELGMSFTSNTAGQITAIRFWKASSETGTHTGSIWSSTGTLLASVAFANETASGWQQQALTTPLTITANTQYVVGVNTGSTYYVATDNGLATQVVNGNLSSVVGSNGLYGSTGTFPTNSYQASNYFRDVVFVP